jgi:hypothetical protein
MKRGTIQMFLEAVAGTARQVFGEPTQRVAPEGNAAEQISGMRLQSRVGSGTKGYSGRARPGRLVARVFHYLPAAVDRRGCGLRRQSAGR